jgi:N-acetylglucosamine malate deacetylase 2
MTADVHESRFLRWLKEGGQAPRTMVVFAHPDDETIGAGAMLARLPGVRLLCATDGAPLGRLWWGDPSCDSREAYAALRRHELVAALGHAGIRPERLTQFSYPDQTLSRRLAELSRRMAEAFAQAATCVVLTHPYEGGHPDHDSVAFGVHAACALLRRQGAEAPEIVEFASYHANGNSPATGTFLYHEKCTPVALSLAPGEQRLKRQMLDAHASQTRTLAPFGVDEERYRAAPPYDFSAPPHQGTLWYERFAWGCTGAEWRALAAEALRELELMDPA